MSQSTFEPPYPAYDPTDKRGFSYQTVVDRWPVILTQVIDQIYRTNHKLSRTGLEVGAEFTDIQLKIEEGKKLIEKIGRLKYEISRDHEMEFIIQDGEAHVESYNSELTRLGQHSRNTWFTAPWLFAECHLYRLLRSYFSHTKHWFGYDPFFERKINALKKSKASIYQIATTMHKLGYCGAKLNPDSDQLGVLFKEFLQICLWGNAMDLSLLIHFSSCDIESLQATSEEIREDKRQFILKDDHEEVWQNLKGLKDERVDIVLDNAGFELFTDLVFADFLVTYTPHVSRVVFHAKLIPWFVSDVTPSDFEETISALLNTPFSSSPNLPSDDNIASQFLRQMVTRWKEYLEEGIFALSVPLETRLGESSSKAGNLADFWTAPWPFWDMKIRARQLWEWLSGSGLVIFKGDLNYRKLTGDVQWPIETSFQSAIGPLAGSFPLVSLRTNKADVIVGIKQEVADKLDQHEEQWRVNGQYALVSFVPASQRKNSGPD